MMVTARFFEPSHLAALDPLEHEINGAAEEKDGTERDATVESAPTENVQLYDSNLIRTTSI